MSAAGLAALMRAREVSPVEVVGAHLRRIERLNPRLNALVAVAPDALERAREAEAVLTRGVPSGALEGVPVTVKDTIDVRGLPAVGGSRLRAGRVAESDAPAVARLRAAGAVIIGKTNCPEFALDYTSENPVYGRTNNPYDLARTPGGSSGGCGAAVAACMTVASLGSDLAGSIRIPAHFCGVAGLKPTARRVPGGGHVPPLSGLHSLGATLGPLARNVEDLRLLFRVLARGGSPAVEGETDEGVALRPSGAWRAPSKSLRGVRLAVYRGDGEVPLSEETGAALKDAAAALEGAGLKLVEETPPCLEGATDLWLALFEYATQRFVRGAYVGREDEAGRAAGVILERAARWGEPALESVLAAWERRDAERERLLAWMEHTPLFVAPVGAVPAFRHEEFGRLEYEGRAVPTFRAFAHSHAANVFDLPAACVPAGRTRAGLPLGVQIVGRPFEEELVLDAARAVEESLGGWRPPPEALPGGGQNPL